MSKIETYVRYFAEGIATGNFQVLAASLRFALLKKLPQKNLTVNNRHMGTISCRANTTDFMFSYYSYEHKVKQFIKKHSPNYNTFFDIGACIGDYSLWMAKLGYDVYSFEPVGENYVALTQNIAQNNLENKITPLKMGLGSQPGTETFNIRLDNKGASSRDNAYKSAKKETVVIETLDSIMAIHNLSADKKYLIKIDAEGMEEEVMAGGRNFFNTVKNALIIMEVTLTQKEKIEGMLKGFDNYRIEPVDEFNVGIFIEN